MNNHARTVLWIGLFMIMFNVVIHWAEIRAILFSQTFSSQLYQPGLQAQKRTAKRSVTGTVAGSRL